ncbi:MAG: DUF4912 domain-containing protein [Leptospirillia bacterium]
MQRATLEDMTVKALRELARELGVVGMSKRRKAEVIEAILLASPDDVVEPPTEVSAPTPPEAAPASMPAQSRGGGAQLRSLGDLPGRYGVDRIVLLIQKPGYLYTYWEVTEDSLSQGRLDLGIAGTPLALRVYDLSGDHFFDIEVHCPVGDWYIPTDWEGRQVRVEIGLMGPGGRFYVLASSNELRVPKSTPSTQVDAEWAIRDKDFEALYALSGGFATGASDQIQRAMREGWGPSSGSPTR